MNEMDIKFPNQLFINNEFIDASDGNTFDTINPTDGSVSKTCCIYPVIMTIEERIINQKNRILY